MDQVNLAHPVEQRFGGLVHLVVNHPLELAIGVAAFVGLSVILWLISWVWLRLDPEEPTDERATLRGTAQVVSLKTQAALGQVGCMIELEVQIPGREPYVTVKTKTLEPGQIAAVQPGKTVQVRVDPDDNPKKKKFRIDLNEPVPPPQAESSG